jgi:hypothetical protein
MKTTTIRGWGGDSIEVTTLSAEERDFLFILLATGGI